MDADLSTLSVRELKEELAALGSSAEGCVERKDIEERLGAVRAQNRAGRM
jgi:hypothetical protein